MIAVRFIQDRNEALGLHCTHFGTLIAPERETEFLNFIGMSIEDIPVSRQHGIEFEVELDGYCDWKDVMSKINTVTYNGKNYKL